MVDGIPVFDGIGEGHSPPSLPSPVEGEGRDREEKVRWWFGGAFAIIANAAGG